MKLLLRNSRTIGARHLLLFAALVYFSIASFSGARASTSYTYYGSHTLTWNSNSERAIWISRTGGYDSLTVYASLTGSSKFTLNNSAVWWSDSSRDTSYPYDTSRYFIVSFNSTLPDTNFAKLVIHDGQHSDTIALIGYGTLDPIDYTIRDVDGYMDTARGINSTSIYFNPDSGTTVSFDGILYNHRTTPIDVLTTLSDSSYWSIDNDGGYEDFSLNGTSDHSYGRAFQVRYTPHGVYLDSVEVHMNCSSPTNQSFSFWIYAYDLRYAPHYYIPTVTVNTLIGAFDTTVCGTVTIRDSTTEPISLTDVSLDYTGEWSISGLPSLPYLLNPGAGITFSICFEPNSYRGQYYYNNINVSFEDTSGLKGSTKAQTAAVVYEECLQSLRAPSDTLKLDEVLAGGYVETSEKFIARIDTELFAGQGIMYQGGSIQVISPQLPMRVHSGDTVTITIRVTPASVDSSINGEGTYYGYLPLSLGGCSSFLSFMGTVTDSSNTDLQLFSNERGLLAMTTGNSVTVDTFWFDNNDLKQVIVSNVALSQGTNFKILGELPHSPNDTLTSGNKMGVFLQFDGDTNGFYHDSLAVTTDASITHGKTQIASGASTTLYFNLEAFQTKGAASVMRSIPAPDVEVSIVPNPSSGPVEISVSGTAKASIEVYDLLVGKQIIETTDGPAYDWNPENLPNGVYIARVSGVDANGQTFVISKRISLQR